MNKYDASSIEVIENLEAVRKRPGMYIGDTNFYGLHHLVKELLDNSIDEALGNFANQINVVLNADNSLIIEDNGRGIPVDIHKKTKKPAVQTIFTTLHAGGKFGGKDAGYIVSGGLHGVGASVVNALSKYLKVTIYKNKSEYYIDFHKGGKIKTRLQKIGPTTKTGTKVEFLPDDKIFSSINFSSNSIIKMLKTSSYLTPNLTIEFIDNKNEEKYVFKHDNGLIDFIQEVSKGTKQIAPAFQFESKGEGIIYKCAVKFTNSSQEIINSYVNNIETPDGGSHESGFKTSLTRAINEYASKNKLKKGSKPLEGVDIREGMFLILSVYLPEHLLQFEGQTKSKLSSNSAKTYIETQTYLQIKHYLATNNKEAKQIINKSYASKNAREAARRAREVSKELRGSKTKSFAGKLVMAQSKKAIERELFVVEGDSAGGSAKLGRDRKIQSILPLKGKVINSEKATFKAILANDELNTLIHAIGGGLGEEFDKDKCNYGKIIIMTDADTDGAHIQALILTFLYRFMKPLIDNELIYIALPPLFKVTETRSHKVHYLWSKEELNELKKSIGKFSLQRYKGLGEMNSEQLWETTMDPSTRTLIKVTSKNVTETNRIIETLMGQDPKIRRKWLENNIKFTLEDEFIEETKEQNLGLLEE